MKHEFRHPLPLRTLLVVIPFLAIALPAAADPDLNCAAYANAAVAQANHLKSLGCNYQGGRWSADYDGHFNWCRTEGVSIMDVSTEDQRRKAGLKTCQARTARCDTYAREAVQGAAQNVTSNCKYTGSRWSADYAGHKTWCMAASETSVKKEEDVRGKGLSECLIGDGSNLPKN